MKSETGSTGFAPPPYPFAVPVEVRALAAALPADPLADVDANKRTAEALQILVIVLSADITVSISTRSSVSGQASARAARCSGATLLGSLVIRAANPTATRSAGVSELASAMRCSIS